MPIGPKGGGTTQYRPDIAATLENFDLESDRQGFIGHRLFPVFETGQQNGRFPRVNTKAWLQKHDTRRASGASYPRASLDFGEDDYVTVERGLEVALDDREAAIYKDWFDFEINRARFLVDQIRRDSERRIATLAFKPSSFNSEQVKAVAVPWSEPNSTPIQDVDSMTEAFYERNGIYPNAMVMSQSLFRRLRMNDEVKEAIQSGGAGDRTTITDITATMIGIAFGIEHVLVAGGATAKRGGNNPAREITLLETIWDKNYCGLFVLPKTSDLAEPTFGRVFHWSGDGSQLGGLFEEYYDDSKRCSVLRIRHEVHEKIMVKDLGSLLTGCWGA